MRDTKKGGNGLLTKKRGVRNPKPRSVLEDHPPWARETTTEKGIDATTVEQLRKEMENLKRSWMTVRQGLSIWTINAYGAIAPNLIARIVTSTRRHYDGILSTTREIGFIRWCCRF